MKTKVVLLVDVLEDIKGGAERQIFELMRHIDRDSFELMLLVLHQKDIPVEVAQINWVCQGLGIKRIYSLGGIIQGIRFSRFLRKQKVQVLVTYHFGSDVWGAIWGRLGGVDLIVSNRRDAGFWRKPWHIFMYKIVNYLFDRIIVVSDAVKRMVQKEEGLENEKILTLYNGVDINRFPKEKYVVVKDKCSGINSTAQVIGYIGNFNLVKGHSFLLKAIPGVLNCFPRARFLLIGDGPLKNDLLNEAKLLGIEKNVYFLGKRNDIPELLATMDVCVLPSLSEGFSNSLLEYMASAKPIVATDVGGNPELIQNDKNGLLVKNGDSHSMSEKIIYLLNNESERIRLGNKARLTVEQKFTIDSMVKEYEKTFINLALGKADKRFRCGFKRKIKITLSSLFFYSGAYALCKYVNRKKPVVVSYHRIVNDFLTESRYSPAGLLVTSESFIKQIEFFKKEFNFISMGEYLDWVDGKKKLPDYSILITFDDGYMDNYTVAYPILKRYAVPATIFLATDYLEGDSLPPWEKPRSPALRVMLTWREVVEMSQDGVTFGSHTGSHLVADDTVKQSVFEVEVNASKAEVENKINMEINTFSFSKGAWRKDLLPILEKSGYKCAFDLDKAYKENVLPQFKRYVIPRISINEGMYVGSTSKFNTSLFAWGIKGISFGR